MICIRDLIGVKFTPHGRSKEEGYDCYGLAMEVLRRYGKELPDLKYNKVDIELVESFENLIPNRKIEKAEEGCIVELSVNSMPMHVAVYVGNGHIIHAMIGKGVVYEPLYRWNARIVGCYNVKD